MTTERTGRSKADLLQDLRSSGQTVVERLRALPAERLEEGRYENGWNGRQILGHIASMEWTYPRLIDVARQGASPRGSAKRAGSAAPATRGFRSSNDDYNRRQVAKRADASIEELLAEFKRNRQATIAAVEGVEEALLVRTIRSAGGITGTLADVTYAVTVQHVLGHAGDILGESLTDTRW